MEQIYTIPVNEAFEASADSGKCPFCALYKTLETNELDLILGASMMEPDVRKKTNAKGFCTSHMKKLFQGGKKLPLALILESHLAHIEGEMNAPGILPAMSGASSAKKLSEISDSCYICERIEYNFSRMVDCAAYLWETDEAFRRKVKKQGGFCLHHFSRYISVARERMKNRDFKDFYTEVYAIEDKYMKKTSDKISRFVKSFDYRFSDVPLDDAKTAVEDAIEMICGND